MAEALRRMGLSVVDSQANFLLVGGFAEPSTAWQQFLDAGILVRDVGIAGHLRISIGLEAENDEVLRVARELTGTLTGTAGTADLSGAGAPVTRASTKARSSAKESS